MCEPANRADSQDGLTWAHLGRRPPPAACSDFEAADSDEASSVTDAERHGGFKPGGGTTLFQTLFNFLVSGGP